MDRMSEYKSKTEISVHSTFKPQASHV